jgi:hypothetical protein
VAENHRTVDNRDRHLNLAYYPLPHPHKKKLQVNGLGSFGRQHLGPALVLAEQHEEFVMGAAD